MTAEAAFLYRPVNIPPTKTETITGLFLKRVACTPQAIAYRYYDLEQQAWLDLSWQEIAVEVARWQQGYKQEGLSKGDRIAIMAQNSCHWVVADQAALGLGLPIVPLYVNDQANDVIHIIRHSGARLLVIDGHKQWRLLKDKLANDEQILRIISVENISSDNEKLISAEQWLSGNLATEVENHIEHGDLATVVYTSGTTGPPKGVMLSHNNIVSNVSSCMQAVPVDSSDTFLSFLPLSHMLERTVGYYLPILGGSVVAFTRGIPFLSEDIMTIKPSRIISVPRIYERIHARLVNKLEERPAWIRKLFKISVNHSWQRFNYRQGRATWSLWFLLLPLLDMIFARKLQHQLGGRLLSAICGGAPLSPEIARVFVSLGVPLLHGYGLTEASPVVSVNRLDNNIPESIGLPLTGFEIKTDVNNELIIRGDSVMQGYWKDEKGTAMAIDSDKWLHTGDIATIKDGFIYITGRLKEIIVLSTGEKVSPADMELAISGDPLFEQVIVVGEGCPYMTAIVVLDKQQLTDDLKSDGEVQENLVLERVAQRLGEFPSYEQIRRLHYTFDKWTVDNELLTPTFKLKRKNIIRKYENEIAALYEGHVIYRKDTSGSL